MVSIVLGALLTIQAISDPPAPSAIEQALVDYLCRTRVPALSPDAYRICYNAQLASMRDSFGRNLGRLSAADRATLDAACGQMQESRGRDAYLACLNAQLTAVRSRRGRGKPLPPPAAPAAPAAVPEADAAAPMTDVPPLPPATSLATRWIVGIVSAAALVGGGALLAMRLRRPRVKCRNCGADVAGAGDLCPACRHAAAENLRRAAAERAHGEQAEQQKARRHLELEQEEARREQARREEAQRLRQQEEERLRREQEQKAEEARRRSEPAEGAGDTFDPHVVLGVPGDATPDAIRAAYEQLKAKYDENKYAHLGVELQEHFKSKAQAVERAYAMLRLAE
jgi:hypothetical protein